MFIVTTYRVSVRNKAIPHCVVIREVPTRFERASSGMSRFAYQRIIISRYYSLRTINDLAYTLINFTINNP